MESSTGAQGHAALEASWRPSGCECDRTERGRSDYVRPFHGRRKTNEGP